MQTVQDLNDAAARLFGYREATSGSPRQPYGHGEYQRRLGIDIQQYLGYYAEIGGADSPVGPVTPATERIAIKPILAIHQTNKGNFSVQALTISHGFFNHDRSRAWVKTDHYEALLGDSFFQEVMDETERIQQAAAKKEPSQRDVKVQIGADVPLSPHEREIFEKLKRI